MIKEFSPTSESLAATIVANRILGLYQEESKQCMSELLRRKEDENDQFDFESYIKNQIDNIESINDESRNNNGLTRLMEVLSSFRRII